LLVQGGCTAEVKFADGLVLQAWPVEWLGVQRGDVVAFLWMGDDRVHYIDSTAVEWDDGAVRVKGQDGTVVAFEPFWNNEQRDKADQWAGLRNSKQVLRKYEMGGWVYGKISVLDA
jgi:hypothetical protein